MPSGGPTGAARSTTVPSASSSIGSGGRPTPSAAGACPAARSASSSSTRHTRAVARVGDVQPDQRVVHPAQHLGRLLQPVVGDPPDQRLDLAHRRGGLDVVAHHVADDQHGVAVGLQEGVVPVAADRDALGGRPVPDRELAGGRAARAATAGCSCSRSATCCCAVASRALSSASAARREAISAVRSSASVSAPRSGPLTRVRAPNSSPRAISGKAATAAGPQRLPAPPAPRRGHRGQRPRR